MNVITQTAKTSGFTKKGQERKAALLDAAHTLFLTQGYGATSLDACVASAGGSKASVYKHFGCKKGLFIEWVKNCSQAFFQNKVFPSNLQGHVLADVLFNGLMAIYNVYVQAEFAAFVRVVMQEAQLDAEIARISYEIGPMKGIHIIMQLLQEAASHGDIVCDNPKHSAILYFGISRYMYQRVLLGLPPLEQEQEPRAFCSAMVNMFLNAHAAPQTNERKEDNDIS